MADYGGAGGANETPAEAFGRQQADIVRRWSAELEAARKGPYKKWLARAKSAVKRYRDEDVDDEGGGRRGKRAQFNVLWSNVQTLGPAVYAKSPKAVAERRYLDRDAVARAACVILERSLDFQVEESGFNEVMKQCRIDYLLAGIGDAWHRYESEYEPTDPPQADGDEEKGEDEGGEDEGGEAVDGDDEGEQGKLVYECCKIDYTHYTDTLVSPARYWQEVTWRAKRAFYTRTQLRDKFGRKLGNRIPLAERKDNDVTGKQEQVFGKAEVWQIWDLVEQQVVYICEAFHEQPLRVIKKNALGLKNFVPSPRPVRATTTNDSVFPIPDYTAYQDQARELDSLTARIAALTRAIKVVGVHDGSFVELERLFTEGIENKTIGIKNWAKLAQTAGTNGMQGAIAFLPIRDMAEVLMKLFEARSQVKNDLYEITGMSDIVRGASDPNETLGAQQMKGQYASVRLNDRREEFQRFVRDNLVIMAEIICEHFSDKTLWNMSDFEQWAKEQDLSHFMPPQPPMPPMMGHNGGPPMDAPAGVAGAPGAMMMPPPEAGASPPGAGVPPGTAAALPGGMPAPAMGSAPGTPPMPGIPMMPPGPPPTPPERILFGEAVALLRKDRLRSFRVDIETDSTLEPDAQAEKQSRTEFITAVTQFLAQSSEMAMQAPQLMPVLGSLLLFGARGFRVGRDLESKLETLVTDLEKQARNPAPKPPSPEQVKANAIKEKAEADKAKVAMGMQADQQKMQMEQQRMQMEMQRDEAKNQMELQHMEAKQQLEQQGLMMKLQGQREQMELDREKAGLQMQLEERKAAMTALQQNRDAQLSEHEAGVQHELIDHNAEAEKSSLQARGEHDERKMALTEKAAAAKAKAAGKPNGGATK